VRVSASVSVRQGPGEQHQGPGGHQQGPGPQDRRLQAGPFDTATPAHPTVPRGLSWAARVERLEDVVVELDARIGSLAALLADIQVALLDTQAAQRSASAYQ